MINPDTCSDHATHQIFSSVHRAASLSDGQCHKNSTELRLILLLRSPYLFNEKPRRPVFKEQRRLHGLKVNIRSGDRSLRPACRQSLKAGWRRFHCVCEAGGFLPTRQAASPEPHLNLAHRVWQKETNQAVSKQPKDESTSAVPNLYTGALGHWAVMRLPYDAVWCPHVFSAVYISYVTICM